MNEKQQAKRGFGKTGNMIMGAFLLVSLIGFFYTRAFMVGLAFISGSLLWLKVLFPEKQEEPVKKGDKTKKELRK